MGAFRKIYGSKKRRGSAPGHYHTASGSIARHILQARDAASRALLGFRPPRLRDAAHRRPHLPPAQPGPTRRARLLTIAVPPSPPPALPPFRRRQCAADHLDQELEKARVVEKDPKGGRRLTADGRRDLDRIAGRVPASTWVPVAVTAEEE